MFLLATNNKSQNQPEYEDLNANPYKTNAPLEYETPSNRASQRNMLQLFGVKTR